MEPVPRPTRNPQKSVNCHEAVITVVSREPAATVPRAATTARRIPKRSMSAAANAEDYGPQERGRLADPLRRALAHIPATARVASICTGSFVPAAAGLLEGRRATTHGKSCDELRTLYPEVNVDPDVLYTDDRGVLTSAGVAAGIDLCLHMIRSDHGAEVANTVARRTVVPPHREGGQAQYIERPVPETGSSSTAAARAHALGHLGEPLALRDPAREASMSVRTLSGRFQVETGGTPMRRLTEQRLQHARR